MAAHSFGCAWVWCLGSDSRLFRSCPSVLDALKQCPGKSERPCVSLRLRLCNRDLFPGFFWIPASSLLTLDSGTEQEKKTKEERVSVGRNLVPGHRPDVLSKFGRASSGPHFSASVFGDLASTQHGC